MSENIWNFLDNNSRDLYEEAIIAPSRHRLILILKGAPGKVQEKNKEEAVSLPYHVQEFQHKFLSRQSTEDGHPRIVPAPFLENGSSDCIHLARD